MKSSELQKNPIRRLGESTDNLRLRILAADYPSSAIISEMLYRGEYEKAYNRCVEAFGATHTFSLCCYDLHLQWERLTGKGAIKMIYHCGLDKMYNNNHGNESLSIINALSGILNKARSMGAEEYDCEGVRREIITGLTHKEIKKHLSEGCYLVRIDGGFMDVGYLLSLRF